MAASFCNLRGNLPCLLLWVVLSLHVCNGALSKTQLADFNALARGVGTIAAADVVHSRLVLSGDQAFAVATDANGGPCIAATRWVGTAGGRLVQFAHEGVMLRDDWGVLLTNAALWAGKDAATVKLGYATDFGNQVISKLVTKSPRFQNAGPVSLSAVLNPKTVNVLVLFGSEAPVGRFASKIRTYIQKGGGVLIGSQAWYWSYTKDIKKHPNNLLTAPMGIFLSKDYVETDFTLSTNSPPSQIGNVATGLACLSSSLLGTSTSDSDCQAVSSPEGITTSMQRLVESAAMLDPSSTGKLFYKQLKELAGKYNKAIPAGGKIQRDSPEGLGAFVRTLLYKHLPPSELKAAPEAASFPGLPAAGSAPLGPTAVTINGSTPWANSTEKFVYHNVGTYWQSLGLYAGPGRPVTVTLPASLAAAKQEVTLQIGGWTDVLYDHEEWYRLPEIVRQYRFTAKATGPTTVTISSATGGLIYVILPSELNLGPQELTVTGAFRAAMMREGMSQGEWQAELAASPAPWGEVVTQQLVISTPRSALEKVTAPGPVTRYWTQVMDSHAWMVSISNKRPFPMRMQHDVDISNGYMHSGYPFMTFMDVIDSTLDPVNGGNHWGQFHELGHNHQFDAWTWGCTVEVSCNFFSVRAQYVVRKNTNPDNFYGWFGDTTSRRANRENYLAAPDYSRMCDAPDIYLDSFMSLLEEGGYGFELLRDTIASYKAPGAPNPTSDGDKVQAWVIQQSKAGGCNFAPHYEKWGWPLTDATKSQLASMRLPTWPDCQPNIATRCVQESWSYWVPPTELSVQGGPFTGCTDFLGDGRRWCMLPVYDERIPAAQPENVAWKYTEDENDTACMTNWTWIATDGTQSGPFARTVVSQSTGRRWCALPVFIKGGAEDVTWKWCS